MSSEQYFIYNYNEITYSYICTIKGLNLLSIVGKYKINVREYRRCIKNRESRETDNIGYTRRRKNTKCVGHHFNLVEDGKKQT